MYVLGVDFGGGASKVTLLSQEGKVVATATAEYPTAYGEGGMAEQNPTDWYEAACRNIRAVLAKGFDPSEIACVCFDAATHTAVLMDEEFVPLCPSVYWTDTRSVGEKRYLAEHFGEEIFQKCKHEVDTIWTLPELLFVKNSKPELYARVRRVCFAKDYVRHLFTGDFVTDRIEAEGSMLFDFDARVWDGHLLSLIGLTEENMPQVVEPLTRVGEVLPSAAADSGLAVGTPVICGATDTVMEVFAAGGIRAGDMTLKLATAGRICIVSEGYCADRNIINYSHLQDGLYYPGSATKSCAASLRWFRDTFGGDYADFDRLAEEIPAGCEGLTFHPYLMGELTPYANPALRGSFIGVSARHTKAHFIRAVMEGVAMSLRDCFTYLQQHGIPLGEAAFAIGGGAKSTLWRQIVADALGITLITTENNDSSFGSAMCAGIAAGFFADYASALALCRRETGRTEPNPVNKDAYDRLFVRYKKISAFLTELSHEK